MLRLNALSNEIFAANGAQDEKIKVNSTTSISRNDVISTGRLVCCEFFGRAHNAISYGAEKYTSRLNDGVRYEDFSEAHKKSKLLFCAGVAARAVGSEAPQTWAEFKKNGHIYATDSTFLKAMAAIDREVLSPILFSVMDAMAGGLVDWEEVPLGATKEITVRSNDAFLFEDSAWGSGRSTSKNYLYAKTYTITPKVYATNATIKWYQDIVNGDAGRYYAAIVQGMYSKQYAKAIQVLKSATTGNGKIPAGLRATTYTTQNFLSLTDKVAAVNGTTVDNLMAVGTRTALSYLLPVDGTGGAITGLQYGLGRDWFANGFLPKAGGVDLFPVTPAVVPTTQNSTIDTIDTGTDIYILAKNGYKPIVGVYAEGSPVMLTATPGGTGNAQGTADFTIDINVGAFFDVAPIFASKVAVITNVYAAN